MLPSPNGSAIAAAASGPVLGAWLRNASAVAHYLRKQGFGTERPLCVVPAGEHWRDGSLRPALEDLLGAGAVLASLDVADDVLSPEAAAARALFASRDEAFLADSIRDCACGQELIESGFGEDVEVAIEVDVSDVVPVLQEHCFRPSPDRMQPPAQSCPLSTCSPCASSTTNDVAASRSTVVSRLHRRVAGHLEAVRQRAAGVAARGPAVEPRRADTALALLSPDARVG